MRRLFSALLLLLPLAAAGCDSTTEPRIEETRFAAHLGIDLSQMTQLAGGMYVRDLVVGDGPVVQTGQLVAVHYKGWLADGRGFDQRQPPEQPFRFTPGARQVIAGWEVGVPGMRVGGVRQLVIPPSMGYGRSGSPPVIPPNAVLVFEVSAVGVQ